MPAAGPHVTRLGTYVQGANPDDIQGASDTWNDAAAALTVAAKTMTGAAARIDAKLRGRTAEAASPRFQQTATAMDTRSSEIRAARQAMIDTSASLA